jgi:tetratricopeptide (TPR) repeat protein
MSSTETQPNTLTRAFGLYRSKRFAEALELAQEVRNRKPEAALAWYLEGLCELARNEPAQALAPLQRAALIDANEAAYLEPLAIALLRLHRYREAGARLEALCRVAPTPQRQLMQGRAWWRGGDYPAALACFRSAATTATQPDAALALAKALQSLGQREEGGSVLQAALRQWPGDADLHVTLGVDRFRDDAPSLAIDAFAAAVRLAPGHTLAHCLLGITLAFAGRPDDATGHFEIAGQDPRTAPALDAFRYMQGAPAKRHFGVFTDTLRYALDQADPAGLALEFGVYHGRSLNLIASHWPGAVHGFDTFSGLPQDWNADNPSGSYSTDGRLPDAPANVTLHQGLFDETLPALLATTDTFVAFAHVDCDLYESTLSALEPVAPRLRPGSVLLFDEFFGYEGWRDHEHRAFSEICARFDLQFEPLAYSLFDKQAAIRIL